jgi:cell division protein FtsQ
MLKKILKYGSLAAISCYLLFALTIIPAQKDDNCCKELELEIKGNRLGTIDNAEIIDMLKTEGLMPTGKVMDSISCLDIEQFIKKMSLIDECQAYKTNDKRVKLHIVCREPLLKICNRQGEIFYIDTHGYKIDDLKKPLILPVASGYIDEKMLNNEIRFVVTALKNDPFWLAQMEQIYFDNKKEAIITPRMGNHIIELGTVTDIEEKLKNVKEFYRKGLNTVGWNKYSKLNVKISNKVICTKRE